LLQKGLTNQPLMKSHWNHTNTGWQVCPLFSSDDIHLQLVEKTINRKPERNMQCPCSATAGQEKPDKQCVPASNIRAGVAFRDSHTRAGQENLYRAESALQETKQKREVELITCIQANISPV